MCLIKCAKSINIYYRDVDKITKADIIATYVFIISMFITISIYTKNYYDIVIHDLDNCETHNTKRSCLHTEFINIAVPYIGIIYSFFQVFYKLSDITAMCVSFTCCCKPISNDITIELNNVVNI